MLVYKCDGELFSTGRKCSGEERDNLPEGWLTFIGQIKNRLHDAHYIQANGAYHFCSKWCFENFLFKDVNPAQGNGPLNTMTDPNVKTEGDVKEESADLKAAPETANEQATEGEKATEE